MKPNTCEIYCNESIMLFLILTASALAVELFPSGVDSCWLYVLKMVSGNWTLKCWEMLCKAQQALSGG